MPTTRASILIVEDEQIIAMDVQQMLQSMGYDAFATANSAEAALARALQRRPEVVLMDIRLQGRRDGVEAAEMLRSQLPDIRVIYLTANTDEASLERAKRTRPYGFLLKPVKSAQLRASIEIALYRPAAS